MPTTTNFGWTTPADTDLVKDGAAAIRTLAGNIDTSLVDLKGGTTGQVLSKNSNTDLDFVFATPASGGITLLETLSLSGASTTSSSIAGTYKHIQVVLRNFKPAVDGEGCWIRLNSDSNTRYFRNNTAAAADDQAFNDTRWLVLPGNDSTGATGLSIINIWDYANTTTWKMMWAQAMSTGPSTTTVMSTRQYAGFYNQTSAITTLTFLADGGNITSGSALIYGLS
jgi:hypothetical protein